MKTVYQAASLPEAELVRQRLEEVGIPSSLRNVHLQGALGELPTTLLPEVWIHRDVDFARARAEVAEMESARRAVDGPEKACRHCREQNPGNFELCWKCRRDI